MVLVYLWRCDLQLGTASAPPEVTGTDTTMMSLSSMHSSRETTRSTRPSRQAASAFSGFLSVPVSAAAGIIHTVLDTFKDKGYTDKIVMDVCSTKSQIAERLKYHPFRKRYVATHPMAGTEHSGPWAALPGLFDARACIIADQDESDPAAVRTVEELYKVLNMRIVYMTSDSHDVHTAFVSHLSHVTSFSLALTVLDKERDEKHIFDLASGGFSSTVRLAKSNADMWVPIFMQNRDNLLRVIDAYMEKMQDFREAIDQYDEDKVRALIDEANRIKKIIR